MDIINVADGGGNQITGANDKHTMQLALWFA